MDNHESKKKWLVEDCYTLPIAKLGRRLLYIEQNKDSGQWKEKRGVKYLTCLNSSAIMPVYFRAKLLDNPRVEIVYPNGKSTLKDSIQITSVQLRYGERPMWLCACGKVCAILYHRQGYFGFACRACLNLNYELQCINRKFGWSNLRYIINRTQKLTDLKYMKYRPYTYRNKPTKRVLSYFKSVSKWGVKNDKFTEYLSNLDAGITRIPK